MKKYFILILTILFVGCQNRQNKNLRFTEEQIASLQLDSTAVFVANTDSLVKVDLNPYLKKLQFDFGSLIKEVKLIPLETKDESLTDESLLDNIRKILVTDSNIYIMDDFKGGGLVVFDREGKFVKRISNGQGPGEIVRLYDIAYDDENNELVAYVHSFLLFFTPSGDFIRQERLPFGFYNFTIIPQGYVFKTLDRQGNGHLMHLEDYTFFVTDKNFKLKSVGIYSPPMGKVISGRDYLYNNNGNIRVTQMYSDTIYQYVSAGDELKAKYVLDYSKKKLPERYMPFETYDDFDITVGQNDYYYYIGRYLETDNHNVFFLENYNIGRTVIYRDKQSGNLVGGTNADYNLNEIPQVGFPHAVSGNYFISYHFPNKNDLLLLNSSIISDDEKKKIKKIKEDDNPILVFFQLKIF